MSKNSSNVSQQPSHTDSQQPSRRRWLWRTLMLLALLGLVLGSLLASVKLPSVRRTVVAVANGQLERSAGLHLEVDDFSVQWLSGRLEVTGFALASVGQPPFLTTERIEVQWFWRNLRSDGNWRVEEIVVERPLFDLQAPLPQGQGTEDSTSKPLPLSILAARIVDGTVAADKFLDQGWLAGFRAEKISLTGSLQGDELETQAMEAHLQLHRRDGAPSVELDVASRLRGLLTGPWQVDELRATGEGFDLQAEGTIGRGGKRLPIRFEFTSEPARLLPELAAGAGMVEASGALELRGLVGDVQFRAEHFPLDLLAPFVGEDILRQLRTQSTHLDLHAQLTAAGWVAGAVAGEAQAFWRRGEETLLQADLLLPKDDGELRGEFDVELLPAEEGTRKLSGTLHWPLEGDFATVDLHETEFQMTGEDLQAFLAQLETRWPELLTSPSETATPPWSQRIPAQEFEAKVDLTGSLTDPEATLRMRLGPSAAPSLQLAAQGQPQVRSGTARLQFDQFQVSPFTLGEFQGTLDGTFDVQGRPGAWQGSAELIAREVFTGQDMPTWQKIQLSLNFDEDQLQITKLAGRATSLGARPEAPVGTPDALLVEVASHGTIALENPLRKGRLDFQVQSPSAGLRQLTATAVLADGVLRLDNARFETDAGQGELAALVPLASLKKIPALRDALAGQPLVMADGAIELQMNAQQVEASALAEMLGGEDPGLRCSANLEAQLSLDPAFPQAASGQMRVGPALLELPGSASTPPLSFELDSEGLRGELREGMLFLQADHIQSSLGQLGLKTQVPLDVLAWLTAEGAEQQSTWTRTVNDPVSVEVAWSNFDSQTLAAAISTATETATATETETETEISPGADGTNTDPANLGPRILGDLTMQLQVHPADLPQSDGRFSAQGLQIEIDRDHRLVAQDMVTVDLSQGRLTLNPARFQAQAEDVNPRELVATGGAQILGIPKDLSQVTELENIRVVDLEGHVEGPLPASFLDPYLDGGRASGLAEINLDLEGDSLDALEAKMQVTGPGMRILLLQPYSTELQNPQLKISAQQGEWLIEEGHAKVNEGRVDFSGRFTPSTGFEVSGFLDSLRYRLDYGLNVLLSGNFDFQWPNEKQPQLAANLLLERGILRRDLQLDRSILDALFGPPQIPGVAAGDSLDVELDLSIATVDGIRVRNNLADLHVTWSPLTVTGSISRPVVLGGLDVERGGQIFALGQTAQIEHAGLTFHGIPGAPPEVEIETSNIVENSSLGNFAADENFLAEDVRGESDTNIDLGQALTTGFESYYGDRLTDLLGDSLGGTRISYRPLLIFGETDTGPRLTLSRDLSPELAFAVAVSLQETETRTYLVDLHELSFLPGFAAQAFTNDDRNTGATALKTFDFGGGPSADDDRARLREIVFENPTALTSNNLKPKSLRRAIPFLRGDRVPEDVEFEVELDLKDALEKRGFPDAQVEVTSEAVGERGKEVRLHVTLDPRAQAEIVFLGDKPPRGLRNSIASLYHPGFGEEAAMEEMRQRAMEIFRGLGHPQARVDITLDPAKPKALESRRVLVDIEAGDRWKLGKPVFEGVPPEISENLAGSFSTVLERVELALSTPAADSRLLAALERLAYPDARIISRQLDDRQRQLLVVLEPGPRHFLSSVGLRGIPQDANLEHLASALPLQSNAPARIDHIAEAAVLVESALRRRGFTRARVRPQLTPQPGQPTSQALELIAEPGERLRVGTVEANGQMATKESWIRRLADFKEGGLLRTQDLAAARRRLLQSGVFSKVQVETEKQSTGHDNPSSIDSPTNIGSSTDIDSPTNIIFNLEENPRFSIATGLRWVSSEGLGVVVDLLDRNVLGRGATVGLRTRYAADDRSVRLYSIVPRLLASRTNLEVFAQRRQRDVQEERVDTFDLAFQLSRPLGRNWRQRIYGRLQDEERRLLSGGPIRQFTTPLFGYQLIYGKQQVAELEPRGIFGSIDLSGTHDSLGGEQRAWRAFGQLNTYHPFKFADGRFTWGQSLRLGWSDAAGEALRGDLRFRAGGELSVRGYGTGSLGPPPASEGLEAPGGEALLVLNQEFRFRLRDDLHGLLFFDMGNVWDDPKDFGKDLAKSLGLGVRASTPVGLIRLDFAVPLDRRKEDESLEVYLGFGNIF